ncbi:cytochrome b [Sphingomonas lenta]|uniref:Cytochrome B n=1 Tax=Sphingomonas lenta TaxID=1141887 RepID=A0A2A2SDL4_9SPHN|nr:cytochrome b [Sphingomonas lenta]PAX07111.1 cytochrome B [Sphingomonas lenta]
MATVAERQDRVSHSGYSKVAIALHWTIAVLILGNIAGALVAESLGDEMEAWIFSVHKSIGLTVLALSLFRLGWRISHGFPRLPGDTPGWDAVLARATHVAFYFLMIAVPLAGWAMVSAGPRPLHWFWLFDVPKLPVSRALAGVAHEAHEILAFATLGLAVLHVAGALKHHLIDRDDVLQRMLPLVRRRA